jgi:hypothetical protein
VQQIEVLAASYLRLACSSSCATTLPGADVAKGDLTWVL